jgi:hypothetical protein
VVFDLIKAVKMFQIPEADWTAFGQQLLKQLRTVLQTLVAARATEALHLVDTLGTPDAGARWLARPEQRLGKRDSSDIGRLLAAKWKPVIENLLP